MEHGDASSSRRSPRDQRKLVCQFCQRPFRKAEHLQRHEITHTGHKPFVCATCGRAFARPDALARHGKTHSGNLPPSSAHLGDDSEPSIVTSSNVKAASRTVHQQDMSPRSEPGPVLALHDASRTQAVAHDTSSSMCFPDPDLPTVPVGHGFEWPGVEELFQNIVSSDWNTLALPPGLLPFAQPEIPLLTVQGQEPATFIPGGNVESIGQSTAESDPGLGSSASRLAIQNLTRMVTNSSSKVTAAVESLPGLTPSFLDNCLQTYFSQVNPLFPVLHRPTFVFEQCSPSLLLNAIALGSLFIGTEDAISKGEALWRLAHTAVATSWQTLIRYKSENDSHRGVQLLLTALLGQTYAMLSKNESLRLTSHIFHSLGFYWARYCNMFDVPQPLTRKEFVHPIASEETSAISSRVWETWAARETQLRVLLGHYILDGQLAYISGQTTSTIHIANTLPLSSGSELFEAPTAELYPAAIPLGLDHQISFQDIYDALFDFSDQDPRSATVLDGQLNVINVRVVLEGLHRLVRDDREATIPKRVMTRPSLFNIRRALLKTHDTMLASWLPPGDTSHILELTIKWHLVCLDAIIDPSKLCIELCGRFSIEQRIFHESRVRNSNQKGTRVRQEPSLQLGDFTPASIEARRALLHAAAIYDAVSRLPLGCMSSPWLPVPIFAAATVYSAFLIVAKVHTVVMPPISKVHFPLLLDIVSVRGRLASDASTDAVSAPADSETPLHDAVKMTRAFLSPGTDCESAPFSGPTRNLPHDFNALQTVLNGLAMHWGLASEMVALLRSWHHCS